MKKGMGMWIMSKMVMFIFLFSLVAILGGYYMIYKDKVIDDTGKKITQSISETITDALSYQSTFKTIWLNSNIWIRDEAKPYTLALQTVKDGRAGIVRLVIFLAWRDQESPESFASASFVAAPLKRWRTDSPYAIKGVEIFDIKSRPGQVTAQPGRGLLVIRPSIQSGARYDFIIVYKTRDYLCVGAKMENVDLESAKQALVEACGTGQR